MSLDPPAAFPLVGTTQPIFLSRRADAPFINPHEYFWMKVHSAHYAAEEAAQISKIFYETCANLFKGGETGSTKSIGAELAVDTPQDRSLLGIDPEEDLAMVARQYQQKATEAERVLVTSGLLEP